MSDAAAQTASYAVNLAPAVAKRLHASHECLFTLYCRNVSDDRSRVLAIVRNTHSSIEHCLCVFKFSGMKAMQSLKMLRAVPIIESTAIGYHEAGVLSVFMDGHMVEQVAASVSDSDEFAYQLAQLVHVAVLHQFRLGRTHGLPPPPIHRCQPCTAATNI
jgi:hypothetical protein